MKLTPLILMTLSHNYYIKQTKKNPINKYFVTFNLLLPRFLKYQCSMLRVTVCWQKNSAFFHRELCRKWVEIISGVGFLAAFSREVENLFRRSKVKCPWKLYKKVLDLWFSLKQNNCPRDSGIRVGKKLQKTDETQKKRITLKFK